MQAKLEKTLKREDGTRVRIIVRFYSDWDRSRYEVDVMHCEKGKRTWFGCHDVDSYTHRRLSMEDRRKSVEIAQLDYVTEQERLDAKLELWQLMKPNGNTK
jgi:hypothetical protein